MHDLVKLSEENILKEEVEDKVNDLVCLTKDLLDDVREKTEIRKTYTLPITELATLGSTVASLMPAFKTVAETNIINGKTYYELANAGAGDFLKTAKNGNFWGAIKTANGGSKMAQFKAIDSVPTESSALAIDPATIMMAVALFSIEQQLKGIEDMQQKVISFLEIESESSVEADVEMLYKIMTSYKHKWDNEYYLTSNHKMVLDIQKNARKSMLSYKKKVEDIMDAKDFIIVKSKISSTLEDLLKKFKYYRLSLYNYSLASMLEIMLSGDFTENNILEEKNIIANYSAEYRDMFTRCSLYLEKMHSYSLENNVLKGLGTISESTGNLIAKIPLIKEGQVDEFLQDKGAYLKENAVEMNNNTLETFAKLHNPETRVFLEKMDDMIYIYNYTSRICFDDKQIYLIA